MPPPIELALAQLLPTVSFLPPDLISLASSLLAQSRAKASSLKPEEEIGRTYACAHIACQRSQKRFDLELGKPAPPVKPKVYEKLLKYLDSVLVTPAGRGGPRTPQANRVKDVGGSGRKKEERVVKTPTTVEKRTPTTAEKRKRDNEDEKEVPDFVMPMIRAICKATRLPAAVPHVHVGARAVVKEIVSRNQKKEDPPSRKRRRTVTPQNTKSGSANTSAEQELAVARWPALLIALVCLTAARLKDVESDSSDIKSLRKTAIQAVHSFCEDKKAELPEGIEAKLKSLDADLGFYLLEAEDCGWLEMDWYKNIPSGQEDEPEVPDSEDEEDAVTPRRKKAPHKTPLQRKEKHGGKIADRLEGAAGLGIGLATMFQSAVDWLSDERRADYASWKKSLLKEIAAVEQNA